MAELVIQHGQTYHLKEVVMNTYSIKINNMIIDLQALHTLCEEYEKLIASQKEEITKLKKDYNTLQDKLASIENTK